MPEHIHLLINEPPIILVAQFLKALKQITSRKLRGDSRRFWHPAPNVMFESVDHYKRLRCSRCNAESSVNWLWPLLLAQD